MHSWGDRKYLATEYTKQETWLQSKKKNKLVLNIKQCHLKSVWSFCELTNRYEC